jgi:spermidine/putrescine transport system substrate-binding protein
MLTNAASGGADSNLVAASSQTLRIFTWANYTDAELLKTFQEKTGIQTIVDTYDSNETMLAKMQAGGGKAYSIVYPSDYMVGQMVKLGMLAELEHTRLSGIDSLMKNWQNPPYDKGNTHSIPAVWGTTGLIFDPEKLSSELKGWDYVWNNSGQLRRRVTMISDVREVLGATLKYLGYSLNSANPAEIEAAYKKLLEIKPTIASFITNGWEDQLSGGDLTLSMAYSQDAIALMSENPKLKYVVPETGSSLWTDTIVIPKTAPNPDGAYQWLNFMLEPENTAKLVERLKISTPNSAAFEQLPAHLKQDQNLFPPPQILAKSEGIVPVPPDISAIYDRYWTELTSK